MVSTNSELAFDAEALDLHALRRKRGGSERVPFRDVDTFEGVVSEPQHLHKYLYAGADPVNNVDPSGYDFGANTITQVMGVQSVLGQIVTRPSTQPTTGPTTVPIAPKLPKDHSRPERERWAREMAVYIDNWKQRSGRPNGMLFDGTTLAAQFAGENAWGHNEFARRTNNWGNIKGTGPAGSEKRVVPEFIDGKWVKEEADFKVFHSLDEFLDDYTDWVTRRAPKAPGNVGRAYYQVLKDAGYATDPQYVDLMSRIFTQIGG